MVKKRVLRLNGAIQPINQQIMFLLFLSTLLGSQNQQKQVPYDFTL